MVRLDVSNKGLKHLGPIPDDVTELYCQNNQLTVLPKLPSGLTSLECQNNQLSELPDLPVGLTHLKCENNAFPPYLEEFLSHICINCLPNIIRYVNAYNKDKKLADLRQEAREWKTLQSYVPSLSNNTYRVKNVFNSVVKKLKQNHNSLYFNDTIAYPDAHNPDLLPLVHREGMNAVLWDDVPNAIQFRHKQLNGVVNNHEDSYIGLESLFKLLDDAGRQWQLCMCWEYPTCTALLYPQEIEHALRLSEGISAIDRARYTQILRIYKKMFNNNAPQRIRERAGGSYSRKSRVLPVRHNRKTKTYKRSK
jgi:hypothetical protein